METKKKHAGGRPTKYTPEKFRSMIEEYLADCMVNKKVPTITGFCVFANVTGDNVVSYRQMPKFAVAIKKLDIHCENGLVDKVINDNKPVGGIFLLKAKYGYIEQQRIDITSGGEALGVVALPSKSGQR